MFLLSKLFVIQRETEAVKRTKIRNRRSDSPYGSFQSGTQQKKTALVLVSLSMSTILLCMVLTGVGSFRVDAYLEQRLLGDVLLASTNIVGNGAVRVVDYELDKDYVKLADSQPGVISKMNYGRSMESQIFYG